MSLIDEIDSLTPDKLHNYVKGMTEVLLQLKDKLHSQDPKVRVEAIEAAIELKVNLEREMNALSQRMAMEPGEFLHGAPKRLDTSYGFVQQEIDRLEELFEVNQ